MPTYLIIFWTYTFALLLLWIYIVSCFSKDVFFNLYVNRARTLLFKPVTWVQSIAPKCPEWAAAGILMVFVLLLRCALAKTAGKPLLHVIGNVVMMADLQSFPASALFSLLSFVVILCQINLIRLALVLRFGDKTNNAVVECLRTASSPFSIPKIRTSAILTAIGLLVTTSLLVLTTANCFPPSQIGGIEFANPFRDSPLFAVKATLFAIIDILALVKSGLILLIILSLGGLAFRNLTVIGMANEWLGTFSRVFFKNPIGIGMLDFTPLLLYYVFGFAHTLLINLVDGLI